MKLFCLIYAIAILTLSDHPCNKRVSNVKYKGRLEIAGICMNYTIKLLEGSMDTSGISSNWTDEVTGKSYKGVFALGIRAHSHLRLSKATSFIFTLIRPRRKVA